MRRLLSSLLDLSLEPFNHPRIALQEDISHFLLSDPRHQSPITHAITIHKRQLRIRFSQLLLLRQLRHRRCILHRRLSRHHPPRVRSRHRFPLFHVLRKKPRFPPTSTRRSNSDLCSASSRFTAAYRSRSSASIWSQNRGDPYDFVVFRDCRLAVEREFRRIGVLRRRVCAESTLHVTPTQGVLRSCPTDRPCSGRSWRPSRDRSMHRSISRPRYFSLYFAISTPK